MNQRMFLFETQEKTGKPFTKNASLNMKNFSNVLIGTSDDIRNVYQQKAKEKLVSPKNKPLTSSMMFPTGGPMLYSPFNQQRYSTNGGVVLGDNKFVTNQQPTKILSTTRILSK